MPLLNAPSAQSAGHSTVRPAITAPSSYHRAILRNAAGQTGRWAAPTAVRPLDARSRQARQTQADRRDRRRGGRSLVTRQAQQPATTQNNLARPAGHPLAPRSAVGASSLRGPGISRQVRAARSRPARRMRRETGVSRRAGLNRASDGNTKYM